MKARFYHEKKEAVQIKVELSADLNKYAKDFLAIFNNVRDNEELFKLENLAGTNSVFVTCDARYEEQAKDFLEQFGEILYVEKVLYLEAQLEWDYELPEEYDSLVVGVVGGE